MDTYFCTFKIGKNLKMKYPILSLLILFSSFAFGQNGESKPPKIAVKVPLNKSVVLNGVSIKFTDVLEDSRCPEGVTCIWAGRAIVIVEVTANGNTVEKKLIFGEIRPGESNDTDLFGSTELTINGLALNPYPNIKNVSEEIEYELLISEEKKQ